MFKLFSKKKESPNPKAFPDDAIIDVRGYSGFKNHLITHKEYQNSGSTLCGNQSWLNRDALLSWVIRPGDQKATTEYYCFDCVEKFNSL